MKKTSFNLSCIVMPAIANIKTRKSASFSLFLLILIAALMLNTGLQIFTRLNNFVGEKTVELNGAHFIANLIHDETYQKQIDFIKTYSYTNKLEKEESILFRGTAVPFGGGDQTINVVVLNVDTHRTISPFIPVEKIKTPCFDSIYLPYVFKIGGGYSIGDTIRFSTAENVYVYKVAGFFEDTSLGSTLGGSMKVFVPDESFKALKNSSSGDMQSTFITVQLTDTSKAADLSKKLEKKFLSGIFDPRIISDIVTSDLNYTAPIKVVSSLLIAFAVIMLAVSSIVVKFRVSTIIEDGMSNIGSLKAVGYTSTQILASITLQFIIISIAAVITGVAITYAALPSLGQIISASVGLLWTTEPDIRLNLLSLAGIIVLILAVTLTTALKVRWIAPIAALRAGIQTHSFKKNYFPLSKYNLGLQFHIGLKNIVNSTRQNIFIILIIASLCFASIFCSVMYYNFGVDKASLFNIVGSERCNVVIYTKPNVDASVIAKEIEAMKEVKQVAMLSPQTAIINDKAVIMEVSDDFDKVKWENIYMGRQPKNDNEIAISGMIANSMKKEIGDTIEVSYGVNKKSYIITGLSQQLANAGHIVAITLEGYNKINPGYKRDELSIYLANKTNSDFIKKIKAKYPRQISGVGDLDAAAESQIGAIVNAILSVMVLILTISVIVIILILYLLIKTLLIKRKREYGIYKATGYTTLQLMTQIAFGFVPVVTAGAILGGIVGYLFSNSALSLLLSGLGIYNAKFNVNLPSVLLICTGMVLISYSVSMLMARRVKKITAYSLITE